MTNPTLKPLDWVLIISLMVRMIGDALFYHGMDHGNTSMMLCGYLMAGVSMVTLTWALGLLWVLRWKSRADNKHLTTS